jgi:hypothetical protein
MLTQDQKKLVQAAARAAGLRTGTQEGRYRLLLAQYRRSNGTIVHSCTQLTNRQIDDFLAICESMGWRHPGHGETYYRDRTAAADDDAVSFAQLRAIDYLAGDMGWNGAAIAKMVQRITRDRTDAAVSMSGREAYDLIEAMKAMLRRKDESAYQTLGDITRHYKDIQYGREAKQIACPV